MDERPTTDDLLERDEFILRLGKALVASDNSRATGVVVGITGEWGSGKSSILKMAAKYLEGPPHGAIVIQFDPWIISGRDDLIERLLIQIATRLGLRKEKWAKNLSKKVAGYVETLAPATDALKLAANVVVPGSGAVAGGLAKIIGGELGKKLDIHQQREELKKALGDCKAPIIVMIDEIDRLDDGEIRSVAQFVRAVADFDRISYLLAYDQKRVAEALGGGTTDDHRARGTAYLEKIVQYQIPLPVLVKEQLRRFAKDALDNFMPPGWNKSSRWRGMEEILFPGVLRTLRDIKRFAAYVRVLADLSDEVDRLDLLGWAALTVKAPRTINIISERPHLVSNLSISPLQAFEQKRLSELTPEQRLAEISPDGERCEGVTRLLGVLFPKIGTWGDRDSFEPNRIRNSRSFLTVLCQGIPPGYFNKADIDAFLSMSRKSRCEKLGEILADGRIDYFLDRFCPIFTALEVQRQAEFWIDLAAFLKLGAQDWPSEWEPWHGLGGKILDKIITSKSEGPFEPVAGGLRQACTALDEAKDWQLLPDFLYSQVWAHGLFGCNASDQRPKVLEKGEAEELCRRLVGRLVDMVIGDPAEIRHFRSPDAFFIAGWSGDWTEECRTRLTKLLDDDKILDTLVLLFFGGNGSTRRKGLALLFDVEAFKNSVEARLDRENQDLSPGLVETYRKIMRNGIRDD